MLKVSIFDSRSQRTLVVEGSLTAPWLPELESVWERTLESRGDRRIVVDLGETTAIDARGKMVLIAMVREGADLIGKGVYTEYLVKSLVERARHNGSRS
jgi:anti-anti-sigma regulatory factor